MIRNHYKTRTLCLLLATIACLYMLSINIPTGLSVHHGLVLGDACHGDLVRPLQRSRLQLQPSAQLHPLPSPGPRSGRHVRHRASLGRSGNGWKRCLGSAFGRMNFWTDLHIFVTRLCLLLSFIFTSFSILFQECWYQTNLRLGSSMKNIGGSCIRTHNLRVTSQPC